MDQIQQQNVYVQLAIYAVAFYALNYVLKQAQYSHLLNKVGRTLMKLPKPVLIVLMALPEQAVLNKYEPGMPQQLKLLVSAATYVINVAFNGNVLKPLKSYDELAAILGSALYAYKALGVRRETAVALAAVNALVTLALRGIA